MLMSTAAPCLHGNCKLLSIYDVNCSLNYKFQGDCFFPDKLVNNVHLEWTVENVALLVEV